MDRIITTHHLRRTIRPASVWTLTTLDEGGTDTPLRIYVPGVWESIPALRNYRGRAVYEQTLHCGGTLRFVFGGVSFRAKVYLDDVLLTSHYGAYTAFDCIARDVPDGPHLLRVEVDNRFGSDSALHVPNDYYSYGGINRSVTVEQLRDAYITRLHVTPQRQHGIWLADVSVTVRSLSDADRSIDLSVTAGPASVCWQNRSLPANGELTLTASLPCHDVQPWSPDSPQLYDAKAVLWLNGEPADDLIDRFGFREVKTEGGRLVLNGEPLFIKGVNRHEEYSSFGSAISAQAMAQDVQLIRDLGCNLVRTSHYPNDPCFLDLCDEYGLLVWEEEHARGLNLKQMQHPAFMEQTMLCIDEMIDQHRNHPCIILWGCLNECDDETDEGAEIFRQCLHRLRQLDPSRPVTAALLGRTTSQVLGDMDVVSMNLYPLWYHNTPVTAYIDSIMGWVNQNGGEGRPYLVSEIGAGAIMGYHDPFGQSKWSEERQAAILREQLSACMAHPGVAGVIIWQFADIRLDDGSFNNRPKCMNNKGLLDEYRRPKMAYATVRELFSK